MALTESGRYRVVAREMGVTLKINWFTMVRHEIHLGIVSRAIHIVTAYFNEEVFLTKFLLAINIKVDRNQYILKADRYSGYKIDCQ